MRRNLVSKFLLKKKLEKYLKIIKSGEKYEIKNNGNKLYLRKKHLII